MIRPAIVSDVPVILSLIRELARYENLSHACVVTEEMLARHLFGPHRAAEALVAEEDGQVVGYAVYFSTYSTFLGRPGIYLEDIFVQPTHRRRGLGDNADDIRNRTHVTLLLSRVARETADAHVPSRPSASRGEPSRKNNAGAALAAPACTDSAFVFDLTPTSASRVRRCSRPGR